MSKDLHKSLFDRIANNPDAAIAECVGAEGMLPRLFRTLIYQAGISYNLWEGELTRDYLIAKEMEAEAEQGLTPTPRIKPRTDRFKSEVSNLRAAIIGNKISWEIFHKGMRMIGATVYSLELRAPRPQHELFSEGDDLYASVVIAVVPTDESKNKTTPQYLALSTLLMQARTQLGVDDADKFNELIALHAEESIPSNAENRKGAVTQARNNNRKHMARVDMYWGMFMRGLSVLRLTDVEFRVRAIRPKWKDLDVRQSISLTNIENEAPPPPLPVTPPQRLEELGFEDVGIFSKFKGKK